MSRKLFYQRRVMDNLHMQFDMMKKKNESLIYNVLPAHVAKDFIGVQRNDDVRTPGHANFTLLFWRFLGYRPHGHTYVGIIT